MKLDIYAFDDVSVVKPSLLRPPSNWLSSRAAGSRDSRTLYGSLCSKDQHSSLIIITS